MKIFVSGITIYFICILVITANAQTDEKEIIIVHPAVGKKIDITERKVFGLFPRVESFRSATVYRNRDGIFTLEVEKRVGRQFEILTREISRKEINELAQHIEYFNSPQKDISLDIKPDSGNEESFSYDDYGIKSILPRDEFEAPNFTFLVIMGTLGGIVVGTIGLIGGLEVSDDCNGDCWPEVGTRSQYFYLVGSTFGSATGVHIGSSGSYPKASFMSALSGSIIGGAVIGLPVIGTKGIGKNSSFSIVMGLTLIQSALSTSFSYMNHLNKRTAIRKQRSELFKKVEYSFFEANIKRNPFNSYEYIPELTLVRVTF